VALAVLYSSQSPQSMPLSSLLPCPISSSPSQPTQHPSRLPTHTDRVDSPCTRPTIPLACWLVALAASLAAFPTLETAEPAELVTLVRPSDALDWACCAVSFTAPAASDVLEALRTPARRTANVDCRSTARDAARDMVRSVRRVGMAAADGVGVCRDVDVGTRAAAVRRFFRSVRLASVRGTRSTPRPHHDIAHTWTCGIRCLTHIVASAVESKHVYNINNG
jgi:hypothetical protein